MTTDTTEHGGPGKRAVLCPVRPPSPQLRHHVTPPSSSVNSDIGPLGTDSSAQRATGA